MSDREKIVIECGSRSDRNRDETRKAKERGKDREKERKIEEDQREVKRIYSPWLRK